MPMHTPPAMLLLAKVKDTQLPRLSISRLRTRVSESGRTTSSTHAEIPVAPAITIQQTSQAIAGSLPPELVQHIYTYLSHDVASAQPVLAVCALVCRSWSDSAVALLYSDLRLASEQAAKLLARTVEASDELANKILYLQLPGPNTTLNDKRKAFPATFGRILRRTYRLTELRVFLASSDAPVAILESLFDSARGCPLRRLSIGFHKRAGFHEAMWSFDGILAVLAHFALRHLDTLTLSNFLFSYGLHRTAFKKRLPPLKHLRLRDIFAFGLLDAPVGALVDVLRGSLTSVDVVARRALESEHVFAPVAARLQSVWLGSDVLEPSLATLTAITQLRIRLPCLQHIAPADMPPRLRLLVVDVQVTEASMSPHPLMTLWRYIMHMAPMLLSVRELVASVVAPERQRAVAHAAALLYALAAEHMHFTTRVQLDLAYTRYFAGKQLPEPPRLI
ncbi:hypothetical protein BKA62DRAFT_769520 [Auriculariales sp. MPI-PUGE-AT-0066]|nr:hypothetical protein BKA62DRAFT_769520 [Auriculariales sp. MPI-PUGE-AT-0066]